MFATNDRADGENMPGGGRPGNHGGWRDAEIGDNLCARPSKPPLQELVPMR